MSNGFYHEPERPLSALFSELTRETATLFRQEVQLARTELTEKVGQAGWGLAAVAAGGLLLFLAVQALAAAAVLGLSLRIEPWQAALLVGVAFLLVGGAILAKGIANLKGRNLAPRRTIDSLRESTRWAKERMPKERLPQEHLQ